MRPHPSQSPALSELGHQLIQHRLHLSIQVGTNTDGKKKGESTRKGVKTRTGKQGDPTFITFGFARPAGLACLFGGECGVVNLGLRRDVSALAPQVLKSEVLEPAGRGPSGAGVVQLGCPLAAGSRATRPSISRYNPVPVTTIRCSFLPETAVSTIYVEIKMFLLST